MNKSELLNAIAEHANLTKADANRALDGLLKTIVKLKTLVVLYLVSELLKSYSALHVHP
jgi:nucleoid DNA-binding protein